MQIVTLISAAFPIRAVRAASTVMISEIAWAGSSLSSADEWIELANISVSTVDVGGWRITGAGTNGRDIILPKGIVIPASGTILISNYSMTEANCSLAINPDVVTSTISLSNSSMLIRLLDNNGIEIDKAGNGSAPFTGFSNTQKATMTRINPELDGGLPESWKTADEQVNLKNADLGTPGVYTYTAQENEADFGLDNNLMNNDNTSTNANTDELMANENVSTSTNFIIDVIATISTSDIATSSAATNLDSNQASNSQFATSDSRLPMNTQKFIRLNEVMAAPATGKEWVELISLSPDLTLSLEGMQLDDATGKIMLLHGTLTPTASLMVIEISSARLNNSGDSVYLRGADGNLVDTLTYLEAPRGTSWARDTDGAWRITAAPTRGKPNIITEPHATVSSQTYIKQTDDTADSDTVLERTNAVSDKCAAYDENSGVYLNELMPDPESGHEWVEIAVTGTQACLKVDGLEVHDAVGRIATVAGEISAENPYLLVTLNSARLNNSGDKVLLVGPSGKVMDEYAYQGSQKGASYARATKDEWRLSNSPTPGEGNKFIDDSNSVSLALVTNKEISTTKTGGLAKTKTSAIKMTAKNTATKTTMVKKPLIINPSYDMIYDDSSGGLRVLLRGTVGTPPRHVTGRGFILLNDDGRGLLVHLPSNRKLPEVGNYISISGTIKFNTHELPYLSVASNDRVLNLGKPEVQPKIRSIAFYAASYEDAYSMVSVSGTVQSVSGSTINIIADNTDVQIKIKPGVKYRASRLKKGDEIAVTGILDITGDQPAIWPRSANEINLFKHAQIENLENASVASAHNLPGWTPFGAAAIAIGAIEGINKLRRGWGKKKREELLRTVKQANLAGDLSIDLQKIKDAEKRQ